MKTICYPNLVANDLVSIQPMSGPVSLVFYLDYLYGSNKGGIASGAAAFDARTGPTGNETYSGDSVVGETVYTGDNSTTDFNNAVLSRTPIRPGTVILTAGTVTVTDDGKGSLVGTGITVGAGSTVNYATGVIEVVFSTAPASGVPVKVSYRYDGEAQDNVPQIDLQLTSAPVEATVRKLRARFSLEAAQNLNALHGLDAEAELTGVMAEVIKHELDREVINDLFNFAGAGTVTWDKTVPYGVSYTEHKESLVDSFISANNLVYSATKRAQTNWIVAGVQVCDVIESLRDFQAAPGTQTTQSNAGALKIGTLKNRWTIIKDPFLPSNRWIQGYKGSSFMDAGYVMAPYIPIYSTPTIILDDFMGRKGIGSSYGKKSINNLFYATGTVLNS